MFRVLNAFKDLNCDGMVPEGFVQSLVSVGEVNKYFTLNVVLPLVDKLEETFDVKQLRSNDVEGILCKLFNFT